jgi:hypothetical protein
LVAFTPSDLDNEADKQTFQRELQACADEVLDMFNKNHDGLSMAEKITCVPLGTQVDLPGLDAKLWQPWDDAKHTISEEFARPTAAAERGLHVTSFIPFVHGRIMTSDQRVSCDSRDGDLVQCAEQER